jgi:(1->4)-alpha-D-glucan 1-alpha-D-glucosylmutase
MPGSRAVPLGSPACKAHGAASLNRIPLATYRVQLRTDFGLSHVRDLLPYLHSLGISDVYLSPLFRAREESSHGYDVVDHGVIDASFGTLANLQALAEAARELGMGVLLDVVPNHMGINDPANRWWWDVLQRGRESEYADYFDIDWFPAAPHLHGKVLLPFLSAPFGETLERGEIQIVAEQGRLLVAYGAARFPLARSTWPREEDLAALNGQSGDAKSFDALEELLGAQHYRLAYWRVAAEEINYRRFFDINDLAAIRVEDPRVFNAVHQLVAQFLENGWVTGLRVDHPDGLYDPAGYFASLQKLWDKSRDGAPGNELLYVVAEKILVGEEQLPSNWAVAGTTGYDFINAVNRLSVDPQGLAALRDQYQQLAGSSPSAADVAYESKREILESALASELNMLADQLDRVARQHRASRDFTRAALGRALREVIACLAVYRTYVGPHGWDLDESDYRHVTTAVRRAKRRNPSAAPAIFDFLAAVLRLENPPSLDAGQADLRRRFVLRLQQVTGPAMAKGLEDTAFYRFYPLVSLNEVGGELDARPLEADEFHALMQRRASDWPHTLSASATHDTKRGEDQRARIHVLSEIADEWIATVTHWQKLNHGLVVEVDGEPAPDRSVQYLLYQTLVGTWPASPMHSAPRETYVERIAAYLQKAQREAKTHTSWRNPALDYEEAVAGFVRKLLAADVGASFRAELDAFVQRIAPAGAINSLAQLVLKATLPGVPDFYQGTEYGDFSLVDPDNRRPVDFKRRQTTLQELHERHRDEPERLVAELAADLTGDRLKQFVTWRTLALRRTHADVFQHGDYAPLAVGGVHERRLLAFARKTANRWIAVIVPRQIQCLLRDGVGCSAVNWGDAQIDLPPEVCRWRNAWTGAVVDRTTRAADLLRPLPVALLASQDN